MALLFLVLAIALHFPAMAWNHDLGNDQLHFWDTGRNDPIDIAEIQYSGLSTFAGLPHMRCFNRDDSPESRYDIAILGAPHDTVRCQRSSSTTACKG
jgi:agmatinase